MQALGSKAAKAAELGAWILDNRQDYLDQQGAHLTARTRRERRRYWVGPRGGAGWVGWKGGVERDGAGWARGWRRKGGWRQRVACPCQGAGGGVGRV